MPKMVENNQSPVSYPYIFILSMLVLSGTHFFAYLLLVSLIAIPSLYLYNSYSHSFCISDDVVKYADETLMRKWLMHFLD